MGTVRYTTVGGEVLAEKRGGVRRQYVPDPLGSTVALLDSSQTETDTFSYWPYGEEVSRTGTTATPFRYVGTLGYYRDSATRSYVRARHLDMRAGRWTAEDPMGFDGGSWNLYQYAVSAPIAFSDPTGRQLFGQVARCAACMARAARKASREAAEWCRRKAPGIDPSTDSTVCRTGLKTFGVE